MTELHRIKIRWIVRWYVRTECFAATFPDNCHIIITFSMHILYMYNIIMLDETWNSTTWNTRTLIQKSDCTGLYLSTSVPSSFKTPFINVTRGSALFSVVYCSKSFFSLTQALKFGTLRFTFVRLDVDSSVRRFAKLSRVFKYGRNRGRWKELHFDWAYFIVNNRTNSETVNNFILRLRGLYQLEQTEAFSISV